MAAIGGIKKMLTYSFQWDILEFFTLPQEVDRKYISPDFEFGNETWNIWIYPNGEKGSSEWISLCLGRRNFQSEKHLVTFKLSLIDKDGEDYKHYTCKHEFINGNTWGYKGIVDRSQLLKDKQKVAPNGILTISCTLSCEDCTAKAEQRTSVLSSRRTLLKTFPDAYGEIKKEDNGLNDEYAFHISEDNKTCTDENEEVKKEDNEHNDKYVFHISKGIDKVTQDLKKLLLSEEDSDVTLKVNDRLFRAHRLILKTRSPVFRSMFQHNTTEKTTGIVDITDCNPDAFHDFLLCLYSGNAEKMSTSNVLNLYSIADKYDVDEIKSGCVEFMRRVLSVDTVCDVLALAILHNELALIESATSFFTKNVKQIILTVNWQTFLIENPTAANELYIKALANFVPI